MSKQPMPVLRRRVLVVLPSPLMSRNFLRTEALAMLRDRIGAEVTVISPNPADRSKVEHEGASWQPYFHPRRWRVPHEDGWKGQLLRTGRYARYLAGLFVHMCLTYRFNVRSGFNGFAARLRQSWTLRKRYLREGLPMSVAFGFPMKDSEFLYRLLYRIYYSQWQRFGPVDDQIRLFQPDLVILSMIQTHMVTPYALAARHAGAPVLGINGSWDQPTTKGPACPGVDRILVQNEVVRNELVRYHGMRADSIEVIGWLQMDAYAAPAVMSANKLYERVGIPEGHRYILFAANAPRLGPHEPAVFREFAMRVQSGALGDDVVLLCRCHPQDGDWRRRWAWAAGLDKVVVEPPDLGPLDHLATLILNAAVVVASAGSINLDAVALDTPTIGLAWEDEILPYWDRPARAYDLEHLAALRTGEGMMFARNMDELLLACRRYLHDRCADAAGRATLRRRYLFRLDGRAAERLINQVEAMLR